LSEENIRNIARATEALAERYFGPSGVELPTTGRIGGIESILAGKHRRGHGSFIKVIVEILQEG